MLLDDLDTPAAEPLARCLSCGAGLEDWAELCSFCQAAAAARLARAAAMRRAADALRRQAAPAPCFRRCTLLARAARLDGEARATERDGGLRSFRDLRVEPWPARWWYFD